jgi:uncharacterized protein YndB with AHSA1/START domain
MDGGAAAARAEVEVAAGRREAFAAFAGAGRWWPREFTWSQEALEDLVIDPREGGLCSELGPGGFRCDWARVRAWAPPEVLELAWHIGADRTPQPDPARASTVEIRFRAAGPGTTRVSVEHRDLERHGGDAAGYARAMQEQGWPLILGRYSAALDA